MGDSLMSWHLGSTNSITDAVANELGEPVVNRSVGGARVLYGLPVTGALGMKIENQYAKGDWDWVVLNGGGNDLWLGCGCFACDGKLDKLIAPDGRRGEIARMVWELRETGARVIYVGYLRSPGRGSVIEHCRDEGEELEARIDRLAALLPGVYFLSLADLVPHGDRSYHSADMIHPSIKASTEIGKRVAALIEAEEAVQ
ncbi:GDSL-type esterase/lipase family protein [Phaeobacter marinintestinus]|uniref:GDSL-type esterase/lipase family protein n=1 Tax=Falsiphaeobacter marinintestinus TaxID=1492905 RepID=UPI0011B566ED